MPVSVILATDNEPSRYRLNEACVRTGTPFVVGRVFTRGIGGEVFAYRPKEGGCLGCLEMLLERSKFRDRVREVDLVSQEERDAMYGLPVAEIKDSPGLNVDIAFITNFHTRYALDAIARRLPERPKNMEPIKSNYVAWGNRPVHPFDTAVPDREDGLADDRRLQDLRGGRGLMFTRASNIKLEIPRAAIEAIFDECDRYDVDETGGRILGTYRNSGKELGISVSGIIEPGPNAQRSQTYFKQDGEYQETVFRKVEDRVPAIEHLGNWHTHHVNGLRHLSGGDIETYRRTVEHANHNTDFFYALLIVEKKPGQTGLQRYLFKNYLMRRGDDKVYEIPASAVTLVESPLVWPASETPTRVQKAARSGEPCTSSFDGIAKPDLIQDQDVISQFYPKVKLLQSKELGIYWRGPIALADGSELEVVVLRDVDAPFECSVTFRDPPEPLGPVVKSLGKATFSSGRASLIAAERACNAQLLSAMASRRRRGRRWIF